jgi:PAS domain-containing protein
MNAEALQQALQRSSVAISAFDAEGRYVFINDAAEGLMGVPRATLLGHTYLEAPNVRAGDAFDTAFRATLVDQQTRQLRIEGVDRHYDVDVSCADGLVVVLWRDVTAVVNIHHATVVERDRWHVLFEQAPALIAVMMGAEQRFAIVNARGRAAVGGRTDLVGKTIEEAFPELAASPVGSILSEVYRTGTPWEGSELLLPFARPDGVPEERFFTLVFHPFRDDNATVIGIMAVGFEVTETVRARRRLETMFDGNLVGNITWRLDGTITNANDAFLRMVGYTREDIASGVLSWRALTPPEYTDSDREGVLPQGRLARSDHRVDGVLPRQQRRRHLVHRGPQRGEGRRDAHPCAPPRGAGGLAREGSVPRDARPRAPQSARPDLDRRRADAHAWHRGGRAGHARAPGRAHVAPRR